MKPKVHILATCRKPDLLRATTLVFDTLRVGFPESEVTVYSNDLPDYAFKAVKECCEKIDCALATPWPTIHHAWIQTLLHTEKDPFIVLDTDMVFWKSCEWDYGDAALSGRLVPQFRDPFTKAITRSRLHGSFLYFNPSLIQQKLKEYQAQFPDTPFNPFANLIYPVVIPNQPEPFFHDTCCLLYQAIGGVPFTDAQLDHYDHLNCGTISDLVAPHLTDVRLREGHFMVFENPSLAKGVWRDQREWHRKHAA